jgi:CRP/FNR family transcriptional regulator
MLPRHQCRIDRCGAFHGDCSTCDVRPFSVCAAVSGADLSELEALSQRIRFDAKATLFAQGSRTTGIFNITSGCVRLSKTLSDGRRQIIGFAIAGDFLGLTFSDRCHFTAEAVEPVTACRFDQKAFSAFMAGKPDLVYRLLEFSAQDLALAREQMVVLGRRSAHERLASFLMGLRKRHERLGRQGATLQLAMGRQDIADYLGLTIETVSRTLTKMSRDKLILVVPDGIRFLRLDHLQHLAAA